MDGWMDGWLNPLGGPKDLRCVHEGRPGVCNDLFATARGNLAVNSQC